MNALQGEIDELLFREEEFWKQKSRVLWLEVEDLNTEFFHNKASERRRHNAIYRLWDQNGQWRKGNVLFFGFLLSFMKICFISPIQTISLIQFQLLRAVWMSIQLVFLMLISLKMKYL